MLSSWWESPSSSKSTSFPSFYLTLNTVFQSQPLWALFHLLPHLFHPTNLILLSCDDYLHSHTAFYFTETSLRAGSQALVVIWFALPLVQRALLSSVIVVSLSRSSGSQNYLKQSGVRYFSSSTVTQDLWLETMRLWAHDPLFVTNILLFISTLLLLLFASRAVLPFVNCALLWQELPHWQVALPCQLDLLF